MKTEDALQAWQPRSQDTDPRFRTEKSEYSLLWETLISAVALIGSASAQSAPSTSATPPLMDRQKEIALALSSCPASIASKAAVYVLEASGYVKIRDSQNGFSAIVQHALPTSQDPQCMDAEGTRTILTRYLKVAELCAEEKSADEIKRFVVDAWANGLFQVPKRPGLDYMLSTENLTPNDKGVLTRFPPHVMFYAPYLSNADIGSDGQDGDGPAFIASGGLPRLSSSLR